MISRSSDDPSPISVKTCRPNRIVVLKRSTDGDAGSGIPNACGVIVRSGDDPTTGWVKACSPDLLLVLKHDGFALTKNGFACLRVPQARGVISGSSDDLSPIRAEACCQGGEHPPPVRAKDRARKRAGVALESGQKLAALSLPEPRGLVL